MKTALTPLVDTHCHIISSDFDQDRSEVLARARSAGVQRLLVPGLDIPSSKAAVNFAEQNPGVYAAIGVHPHNAHSWNHSDLATLRTLSQSPSVVAIGEIGLDYYRNLSPKEAQEAVFRKQLDLAIELELPVVIHNREAIDDVMKHLQTWSANLPAKLLGRSGVLHAYSADLETALDAISAGFYFGVAGPVTYPKAERRREITAQIPLQRLLLETDAPYLSPHPLRGKRNEPAHIQILVEILAMLLKLDTAFAARTITQNASDLFSWNHEIENSSIL
jgi:TatD DNase family protein